LAHLNAVVGNGDYRPTAGAEEVKVEISGLIDIQLKKFREIEKTQISKVLNIEEMKAEIEKK
jgi:hypothetical protein